MRVGAILSLMKHLGGKCEKFWNRNIWLDNSYFFSQVTAVRPVGDGQCIALGYESVLPLVLLTLQGGTWSRTNSPQRVRRPCLEQVRNSMIVLRQLVASSASVFSCKTLSFVYWCNIFIFITLSSQYYVLSMYLLLVFLRRADSVWRHRGNVWWWRQARKLNEKTSMKKQWEDQK